MGLGGSEGHFLWNLIPRASIVWGRACNMGSISCGLGTAYIARVNVKPVLGRCETRIHQTGNFSAQTEEVSLISNLLQKCFSSGVSVLTSLKMKRRFGNATRCVAHLVQTGPHSIF